MVMDGSDRRKVWLAALATIAAVVAALVSLWASETIGGSKNECSRQSVCGDGNDATFGGGKAEEQSKDATP